MKKKLAKIEKKQPKAGYASLLTAVTQEDMRGLSSLYLDPIEDGFKISIWSAKKGLIEGFVPESKMPPFVREVLVKRTGSMGEGESIEIIGKREEDIALIAAEPIDAQAKGTLLADVESRGGEVHLKITLKRNLQHEFGDIEKLAEKINLEVKKNTKVEDYEIKAIRLVKVIQEADKLKKTPKDKKAIKEIYAASSSLSLLSKRYGFIRIAQLSETVAILFKAYSEKGAVDTASLPIIGETALMIERMIGDLSGGPDVDSIVSKISRKD
jgi:hypothetical protein